MWSSGLQFRRVEERDDDGGVCRTGSRRIDGIVIVILVTIMCLLTRSVAGDTMGDECDWFGSGLTGEDSVRSVTPVYLRCTQGEVTWVYPRGALRVVLRLSNGREFRGCVRSKVQQQHSSGAARLFLEARRALHLLNADDKVQCFTSHGGQAAIYVEATRGGVETARETASFSYDLEPLPRNGAPFDPSHECRPCSTAELARTYCTSDLVTRGTIASVEHVDALDVSRITVLSTKVLRRSASTDSDDSENAVDPREVTMYRSRHCGAKHGEGEYVMMARRRLGHLTLTCATRLEEWAEVRRTINAGEDAHCRLES